ncbi:RRP12-like protein [Nymphaea thermarum]|nr:RRP12-like protein [Nymphaea thermarum]
MDLNAMEANDQYEDDGFCLSGDASCDLCESIMARYKNSFQEDHQHLCAVAGAISQELREQKLPLSPISYFGAVVSSLERLAGGPSTLQSGDPAVAALLNLLSVSISRISPAVLKSKGLSVAEVVVRVLGSSLQSPAAVKAGLKCVSQLLVAADKVDWAGMARPYGFLLTHVTDQRPKVRRQAHVSLRNCLHGFHASTMIVPASEGIANIFERSLLLASGSKSSGTTAPDGTKGAVEVLYILNALKDCVPLMSSKASSNIVKYFKTLIELGQPIVTRNIMNILYALCTSPTAEVVAEVLQDLLCSLALSVSAEGKSAEDIIFRSRVIHVVTKKVYSLNRDVCVVKLPTIFNALGEVLACKHAEAVFAAVDALKDLIETCVDEVLIKQGVGQLQMDMNGGTRKSAPTTIERICASLEGFIGYQYIAVWDLSFQILSLHKCLGSALGAMGPENFLSILPLKFNVEDPSQVDVWLLPILKQHTVGGRLSFYIHTILNSALTLKQKSEMLEKDGRVVSSRNMAGLVYSFWSLLPSFCNYPMDTAHSFGSLAKPLLEALNREPELRGLICSSLQILIQQNKAAASGNTNHLDSELQEISVSTQRVRSHYTPEVAAGNLEVLGSFCQNFLSVLFKIFEESPEDDGGWLQSTIGEMASISDKKVVKRFFKATMVKLLKVTQKAGEQGHSTESNSMQIDDSAGNDGADLARARLLDLGASLLPALDAESVDLLYLAIKPALQDKSSLVQKKAYKVLSLILRQSEEFLLRNADEVLKLMIQVLPDCHFSAKRHRLESLYSLIVHFSKDSSEQKRRDIIGSFLTEIILSLKETNIKTRNRAYDLLVKIGHAYGDAEHGGTRDNLLQFFNMVVGCLGGKTPQMISAAVKGLARLAYEFSDLVTAVSNLLPSAFLLLQSKNREIIKVRPPRYIFRCACTAFTFLLNAVAVLLTCYVQADLGLMKVLVAKLQADGLQVHLKSMVEGLLNWKDDTKNHFKAKVKFLLEMLVRKCGIDAVRAVMPEEHMKLLNNIRKTKERKERSQAAKSEDGTKSFRSRATTERLSRWSHTNIFSDVGDGDGSDDETMGRRTAASRRSSKAASGAMSKTVSSRSGRARRSGKMLPQDSLDRSESDDPLNLLDQQKTTSVLRSLKNRKRKAESDDEPEFTADGRLMIQTEDKPRKQKEPEADSDDEMDVKSQKSRQSSKSKSAQAKRQKSSSGWAYTGSEYGTRKAAGDVNKKDRLEPYAYWPLDRKMLNRREERKSAARRGLASVTKLTKKLEGKSVASALKGTTLRPKKKKGQKGKTGKKR